MRVLLKIAALMASTMAFIACLSMGGFLAGIEETGARGAGVLLLVAAVLAFAAAIFVVAASGRVRRGVGRLVLVLAAVLGLVPVVAMSGAALFFSGNPLGGSSPYLDWGSFAIGAVLALGAVALAALAFTKPGVPRGAEPGDLAVQNYAAGDLQSVVLDSDVQVRRAASQPGGGEA